MGNKNNKKNVAVLIVFAGAFGLFLWWQFSSVHAHIEKIMNEGDSTYAIIRSIGGRSLTANYIVNGKRYSYKKGLRALNSDFVDQIDVGDTLWVYFMPYDPWEAYIRIDSWYRFRN